MRGMLILQSVGNCIDKATGMVYSLLAGGGYDPESGVHFTECCKEWWDELSEVDRAQVDKVKNTRHFQLVVSYYQQPDRAYIQNTDVIEQIRSVLLNDLAKANLEKAIEVGIAAVQKAHIHILEYSNVCLYFYQSNPTALHTRIKHVQFENKLSLVGNYNSNPK